MHTHEDQVGGMTWGLRGLKFVSIRGAGHMAHKDQRKASWVMIDSFMKGNNLPYNSNDEWMIFLKIYLSTFYQKLLKIIAICM